MKPIKHDLHHLHVRCIRLAMAAAREPGYHPTRTRKQIRQDRLRKLAVAEARFADELSRMQKSYNILRWVSRWVSFLPMNAPPYVTVISSS